ncbi:unnamed protein product [Fraxinus pennsylvanica]|uniref:OTU domain-containing protein n=1 Tax=Fraxinus pennsylvanica TaxID=56036 RepID=A0AAD1YVK8_9LAMI|nr:unnamed protein product [Fraxinus pennsylvanica]
MSVSLSSFLNQFNSPHNHICLIKPRKFYVGASSSTAPGIDLTTLQSAVEKKDSGAVKKALDQLSEIGWAKKWGSQPYVSRRTTSLRELTTLGIKNAENLAIPSVRNDAAFLFTVVGTTGFLGVLAGQLPGDWGFFVPYLIGSISLIVLALGSISPGLLQAAIGGFSSVFPDYQDRIARHEAAHFLVAYLLGLPILGYSLDIGKEHVNLIDERLEKLIYSGQLDAKEVDRLAVVAMAGLAAEGLKYDKVVGQSADLFTLQRFINRSKPQLSKDQQQNLTRWAVLFAGSLLKNNRVLHDTLISAMSKKATVVECIEAIEKADPPPHKPSGLHFRCFLPSTASLYMPLRQDNQMADATQVEDKLFEEISENTPEKKQETLEEMLSRHRKETTDLQNKEIAMKKAAAKGSKAEQKAKKKQVDEEISKLSMDLKERHAEELASLGYSTSAGNGTGNMDNLVKAIAGVSVTNQADHSKPSKGVKRREKRSQQEAAREQRIQEEQSKIVSDRMIESEKLEQKLEPLGLTINEIKPDGHCLYRAVEDQLALHSGGSSPYTYQELREMVAAYMQKHASDFLPFFLSENIAEGESEEFLAERFENYCRDVESTAAWGGQLELGALTHCLKKHITVFSGSFPDVEMGKEYKSGGGTGSSSSSIMLSYHRHAFGLGEHYNSVVPS